MMFQVPIFGCPRSGTSWLGQIFNSSPSVVYRFQPLFSYEFKDYFLTRGVNAESVDAFAADLLNASSSFVKTDIDFGSKLNATHIVWKEVRFHQYIPELVALDNVAPVVYIFRDPLDMLNSWYRAPKEFLSEWDIRKEFMDAPSKNTNINEFNGMNRWLDSTAMALEHAGDKLLLVSYERLTASPLDVISELFPKLGLAVEKPVIDFIVDSTTKTSDDPYSVFRNNDEQKKETSIYLPDEVTNAVLMNIEIQDRYRRLMDSAV